MENVNTYLYKHKTIFDNKLFCALLFLIFVKPAYFTQIESLERPYFWLTVLATAFLIVASLKNSMKSFALWWTFAFFGIIFVSTYLNHGELYIYCRSEFNILAMCLMFNVWLKKSPGTLLSASRILQIYVYINFATVILYPNGMWQGDTMYELNWFLGYKNPQIRTILPVVALSIIYSSWKRKKFDIFTYALVVVSAATFLLIQSATALVGFTLFLALIILFNNGIIPYPKIINLITGLIAVIALGIAIVFFSIQNDYASFFHNVLQRDVDFTDRLGIWYDSVWRISKQPILGYGYMQSEDFEDWYGFIQATHPHNYFMYVLIRGGFVLFAVILAGFLYANRILMKYIDYSFSRVIIFTLLTFILMGLTEALTATVMLYPMFIMAMNCEELAKLGFRKVKRKRHEEDDSNRLGGRKRRYTPDDIVKLRRQIMKGKIKRR